MQVYHMEKAVLADAKAIYILMRTVYENMTDPSLFFCDDFDFVQEQLQKEGFGIKVCDEKGSLVASLLVRYPGEAEDNLGRELALADGELEKVAHIESLVVAAEHRGNGLQRKMIAYAHNLLSQEKITYVMATVSPHNIPSRENLRRMGYACIATKEKYGGLLREIYLLQNKQILERNGERR